MASTSLRLVNSEAQRKPAAADDALVDDVLALLDQAKDVSDPLRRTLEAIRRDLDAFRGRALSDGLAALEGGPYDEHGGGAPVAAASNAGAGCCCRRTPCSSLSSDTALYSRAWPSIRSGIPVQSGPMI